MPDENPYAAPQTLVPRVPAALPVAELAARRLFPELSTVELRRLAARSQAIDNMSLMWGVLAAFSGIAFYAMHVWLFLIFALVAGQRTWTGSARTPDYWKINLSLDVLVFLAALGFIAYAIYCVVFRAGEINVFITLGAIVLVLAVFSGLSARAHYNAAVLYGDYPHQALIDEVAFRKRNCIQ